MANAARRHEVRAHEPGDERTERSSAAAARALLFLVRREEPVSRPVATSWWVALRDLAW